MADQVALLNQGKVMQLGSPRELYSRPRHRFVADFLGETNFINAVIVGKESGKVLLECEAGRLTSTVFPDDLPDSGNVTCSIRPEAIDVMREGEKPSAENVIDARRTGLIYLGEMAQHQMLVGNDLPLKVFELNPSLDGQSEQIKVAVDSSDVVILHD
jgi:ABC-type Fe3+/spermidine/putrescine transport system ATPase subunit